ncbi:hypothetical protein [Pseudoalteromonas sp.]|uniref:hypothetical protein n=1 Tax=Pseudoalteromonas sp. TaxID=53249 RepID=UPI00263477C8|nr:hypothetical protein [Pseudoalteromonas sp.]MCP4585644.1 hypothetical protein [Pseudoalteromonas sp.]
MSITKTFPFTTPANYTYDTDQIIVDSGKAYLVDQTPTDSTCWATYTTDINLNGGGGVLTGTQSGGAVITANYLDLTGGTEKYVDYAGLDNADTLIQEGAVKFILKPAYSGTPTGIRNFMVISEASGDVSNLINIYQKSSDGNLKVVFNNQTTGTIMSEDLGAWSPTAGVDYEFELNFIIDTTTGTNTFIRLFIDGVQFGTTKTGVTGTRSSSIGLIRVGTNVGTGDTADHSIKDLILYDTVQHTTTYTPGYTLPETVYLTDDPIITPVDVIETDGLDSFTETSTKTGSDEIKYILKKDGAKYYYNSGWVSSDGTYSQSNTAAEIETNKATFTSIPIDLTIDILLHSDDGSTTPEIDSLVVEYDFATPTPETVNTTILWWDGKQNDGNEDTATASIVMTNEVVKYLIKTTITQEILTITPTNGVYEIAIVDTENMETDYEGNEQTYTLTIGTKVYKLRIPQQDSVNLYDTGIIV